METVLPEWLDFAADEHKVVAMFRDLRGLSGDWGEIIATAQTIMSIYSDLPREPVDQYYDEQQVVPLIAASRILDTASQHSFELTQQDSPAQEIQLNLALTAAVAYSMYGNFPSARAIIRRIANMSPVLSPSTLVLIATVAPTFSLEATHEVVDDSPERRYLDGLSYFLTTGDVRRTEALRESYVRCLLAAGSSFEISLLRSARLSLEHIIRLSVARTLREFRPILPNASVSHLIGAGVRILLPPQFRALTQTALLTSDENALIALPTSTGKTLLGALCLLASLGQTPGLVCYLAPYVALGFQVAQFLVNCVPPEIRVHRMMGGFRETDPLDPMNRQEVIVATPERLDSLLRMSPHLIERLRCVVCDEAHTIQNDTRGIRLEGILTRLRMLQLSGMQFRLVLLSAVLSEYGTLKDWIDISDSQVITDTWRPTARRIAFWSQRGQLTWYVGDSPIRRAGERSSSLIGRTTLPWPITGFYPTKNIGAMKSQEGPAYTNVSYLTQKLYTDFGGPILCLCSTKEGTRKVARAIAERFEVISPLPSLLVALIQRIRTNHTFLVPLIDLLERGVAFHNSSLPRDIRQLVEDAVRTRDIQVVASTTTLAEGVDLPFRFAIVVDWLTWQDDGQLPMSPLLFKNIAGRCGRANEFTEGDTVVFDNPVGNIDYTHPLVRWDFQREIFLTEESSELKSAIEQPPASPHHRAAHEAVLASQLMAAIPENPTAEDLPMVFSAHTFVARRLGTTEPIYRRLREITASLLDDTEGAFAQAASPLHLTPLGTAANHTGLSPNSCREIIRSCRLLPTPDSSVEGLIQLSAQLLQSLGGIPEQSHNDLRKAVSNSKSRVAIKPDDFGPIIGWWLSGEALEYIFARLPYVQRSKRTPTIAVWLEGTWGPSTWDNEYDKFVEFSRSVLEGFLPWILRACGLLSEFISPSWVSVPWRTWADMVELGVDSNWAIAARRAAAPGGRKAAAAFGQEWSRADQLPEEDRLGVMLLKNDPDARLEVEGIFRELIFRPDGKEFTEAGNMRELRAWLWQQAGFYATPGDSLLGPSSAGR